jgi:carboxylesterase
MRGWADHLVAEGFAVSLPLLPGHGTTWQELNTTRWTDWYAAVETAYLELQESCTQVFVCAMSMGGALAVRLAAHHPEIAGVVLINPSLRTADRRFLALPLLSRLTKSAPGITDNIAKPGVSEFGYDRVPLRALVSLTELWAEVRTCLPRVTQPILVFRSETDHVVDPSSVRVLHRLVGSAEVTERPLHRSFHVATLDYEAEDIFRESVVFIRTHSAPAAGADGE